MGMASVLSMVEDDEEKIMVGVYIFPRVCLLLLLLLVVVSSWPRIMATISFLRTAGRDAGQGVVGQ